MNLSTQALERLAIDPHTTWAHARCPWCGLDLVLGVNAQTRNLTLVHSGQADPTDTTGTRFVIGCEPYQRLAHHDDLLPTLRSAGVRFIVHQP